MADKTLADQTFDQIVDFAVQQIVQEVLGGKQSLRSSLHWIVDVSARWGKETWERNQDELSKRRRRRKN